MKLSCYCQHYYFHLVRPEFGFCLSNSKQQDLEEFQTIEEYKEAIQKKLDKTAEKWFVPGLDIKAIEKKLDETIPDSCVVCKEFEEIEPKECDEDQKKENAAKEAERAIDNFEKLFGNSEKQ